MTSPAAIERILLAALAAFLVSVPWSVPALINSFWVSVIAEILIWSLLAASVNLLFGYVGLLSFGQALYFGFGMYGVAIGISDFGLSFWPAFALAAFGGAVASPITTVDFRGGVDVLPFCFMAVIIGGLGNRCCCCGPKDSSRVLSNECAFD